VTEHAVLCCNPIVGWGIAIGAPMHTVLHGFDSAHEAYMWCVQTLLIDPLICGAIPEVMRLGYIVPPRTEADEIAELPLFLQEER
jgi:hypothetical protein